VTIGQEGVDLASATLHWIGVDEPPLEDKWGELVSRVRVHRGQIMLSMTPINRPVEWMKKRCDDGDWRDIHFELTVENCWPMGASRPFETEESIAQYIIDVPVHQRAQRVLGAWHGTTVDRWIEAYLDSYEGHLSIEHPVDDHSTKLGIGIDYGLQPGKMAVQLIAVHQVGETLRPDVWFWDEVKAPEDERWDAHELAKNILLMLGRNELGIQQIDTWVGDRSVSSFRSGEVSNKEVRAHLAALLNVHVSRLKAIKTPNKVKNNEPFGVALINGLFFRNLATVHPRCEGIRAYFNHYKGHPKDKVKDAGDAGRYIVSEMVSVDGWSRLGSFTYG
jgi:hypothetical protein